MVVFDKNLVEEAKGIVTLAVLQGPAMDLTHGVPCPVCSGGDGFAKLTDAELKRISKEAVSRVFRLLWLRDHDPDGYRREVRSARSVPEAVHLDDVVF